MYLKIHFRLIVTDFGDNVAHHVAFQVCLSVWLERNLRTATNFFIVSLAISDIMVGIVVMPFGVYLEVRERERERERER